MSPPVLDPATLQRLRALQDAVGEQEQVIVELTGIFRRDAAVYLQKLGAAVTAADEKEARRLVHTLKGAALGVGAARVAARCTDVESGVGLPPAAELSALSTLVSEALDALDAL